MVKLVMADSVWVDQVYDAIFKGDWEKYNAYDAKHRLDIKEIAAINTATSFRSHQGKHGAGGSVEMGLFMVLAWTGWLAITEQGPGDGTLRVVPFIKESTAFLLMHPFFRHDGTRTELQTSYDPSFCGASYGDSQKIRVTCHKKLVAGSVTIPTVRPGETIQHSTC